MGTCILGNTDGFIIVATYLYCQVWFSLNFFPPLQLQRLCYCNRHFGSVVLVCCLPTSLVPYVGIVPSSRQNYCCYRLTSIQIPSIPYRDNSCSSAALVYIVNIGNVSQVEKKYFGCCPLVQVSFTGHVISFQYALGYSSVLSRDTAIFGSVYQHHHQDPASGAVTSRVEYWEEQKQTQRPQNISIDSTTAQLPCSCSTSVHLSRTSSPRPRKQPNCLQSSAPRSSLTEVDVVLAAWLLIGFEPCRSVVALRWLGTRSRAPASRMSTNSRIKRNRTHLLQSFIGYRHDV